MSEESVFMLYALLLGILIVFVYDLLRIFRRVISHNLFWISVEDIVFWGFCASESFLLMYHVSNGTVRWFAVLGALVGMAAYHFTLSPLLVKYVSRILNKLLDGLKRILRILLKPVFAARAAVGRTAGNAAGQGRRFISFLKKRLTISIKMLKMIICKK